MACDARGLTAEEVRAVLARVTYYSQQCETPAKRMAETKPSVLDAPFPDHPRERCNSAIALGQQVSSGVELGATPEAPSSAEANEAIEAIRNAGQGVVVLGLAPDDSVAVLAESLESTLWAAAAEALSGDHSTAAPSRCHTLCKHSGTLNTDRTAVGCFSCISLSCVNTSCVNRFYPKTPLS